MSSSYPRGLRCKISTTPNTTEGAREEITINDNYDFDFNAQFFVSPHEGNGVFREVRMIIVQGGSFF
jgi:hypothetical protein